MKEKFPNDSIQSTKLAETKTTSKFVEMNPFPQKNEGEKKEESSTKPTASLTSDTALKPASTSNVTYGFNTNPAPSQSAFPSMPLPTASGFSFNIPGADSKTSAVPSLNFPPSSSSFSFPTTTSSFSFPTATTASSNMFGTAPAAAEKNDGGDEDGGDDEGEPILEPEKILRNENDKDEILLEVPCKLLGYSKELSEWRDKGKGSFRLTKDPSTSKKRMLVRNTMGKITFNAAFYKGMKVERHKDSLLFSAFVAPDESSKPDFQRFTLKLKADDCAKVKCELEKCIADM